MGRSALVTVIAGLLAATAALAPVQAPAQAAPQAQDTPKLVPDQDVEINYRVNRPDEPAFNRRVRWSAASALERADGPGSSVVIVDHKSNYETLLRSDTHSYLKLEVPKGTALYPDPDLQRTAGGQATVAGLSCTDWNWTGPADGRSRSICVTDSGVLLRVAVNGQTVILAKSVHFRKMKPAIFDIPNNYVPSLAPDGPGG